MQRGSNLTRLGAALLAAALASSVAAQSNLSTEERLDRIERQLEGRGLIDLLNQVEKLQGDVQTLRGEIEVQNHQLEDMERRQKDIYLDIDRRLQQLETGKPIAAGSLPPAAAPGVSEAPGAYRTVEPSAPATQAPAAVMPPPGVAPYAPPAPAAPPAPEATTASPAEQQAAYEKALAILREGRYAEAAAAFNDFLQKYPGSAYADNTYYWLGETYYVTRDFDRALAAFNQLVTNYPQSPKLAGARLKIGYIDYEKQDWAAARRELSSLVTSYPGSTEARLANERLQRMKKEGH
jgi:tol-pal system protein YbgF